MGEFAERVFGVVRRIPAGKVSTYGQVARLIGAPRSARYVGYALRANPAPGTEAASIPCHRVVFKDGRMASGFAFGDEDVQRDLLASEGVTFDDEGRVLMDAHLWDGMPERTLDENGLPIGPPPDFDWGRELAEHPLAHDPSTCGKHCPDCPREPATEPPSHDR